MAGDVRANENVALTAIHTLFAREHNRIVARSAALAVSTRTKFQIARRVVGAESQYITYNEFLPGAGRQARPVPRLQPEREPGARERVRDRRLPRSQHDPRRVRADRPQAGTYTAGAAQARFPAAGIAVERQHGHTVTLVIPLVVAFGNPDLLEQVGLGPILQSLGRSVSTRTTSRSTTRYGACSSRCRSPDAPIRASAARRSSARTASRGVADLGADRRPARSRSRDAVLQRAAAAPTGCRPATRSRTITGEATERFPRDPAIDAMTRSTIRTSSTSSSSRDDDGNAIEVRQRRGRRRRGRRRPPDDARGAAEGDLRATSTRSTPSPACSRSRTCAGSEFGPLQLAIWKRQFEALRDGRPLLLRERPASEPDRAGTYGITYRHTLAELIRLEHRTRPWRTTCSWRPTRRRPRRRPRNGQEPAPAGLAVRPAGSRPVRRRLVERANEGIHPRVDAVRVRVPQPEVQRDEIGMPEGESCT